MIVKNVEKKDEKIADFQVEASAAEFEQALNKAYIKEKKNISIPGFRKGKAPRAVIENMYGKEVFYQDALDEIAPQAFEYGYDNCGLKIVGTPSIKNVDIGDENTVTYTFEVELYPVVTLGEYTGLSAAKECVELPAEKLEEELREVLKRNSRMIDVDGRAAELGDTANIDFDGYLEGERFEGGKSEGFDLELGSGTFVPGFEDQVVGMQIGEEKDIDITFPTDYVAELAGKAVVFKVKLNSLTKAELPELDDDFVQDISEFNTVDEFKADLQKKLEESVNAEAERKWRTDIMTQACDNMTVELPECMINAKETELLRSYAQNFGVQGGDVSREQYMQMLGLDDEAMNATIRPAAVFQVKSEVLLDAVAEKEGIEPTEEEFNAYVAKVAESIGAKSEDILGYFGDEFIKSEYKKEKATDIIMNSAVVCEAAEAKED